MKLSNKSNTSHRCQIHGLRLTQDQVECVADTIEYPFHDLDLLLLMHKDKLHPKLYDDLFFERDTIEVIEYRGNPYAIKLAN